MNELLRQINYQYVISDGSHYSYFDRNWSKQLWLLAAGAYENEIRICIIDVVY